MRNSGRPCANSADMPGIMPRSFALGFAGLLLAMVVGFVSASEAWISTSSDYGYDDWDGIQLPSVSAARSASICSDLSAAPIHPDQRQFLRIHPA
jgi:hypothetical protein